LFASALKKADILLADGISIVYALKFLTGINLRKQAGADLFHYEMEYLNKINGKCFFLGSTLNTLRRIEMKIAIDYPNVKVQSYSPPFSEEYTNEENKRIILAINEYEPDVLFVGMTAPKQEKWSALHFEKLNVKHICCIGAVFDFYAGNIKRAPSWMIKLGLEWLFRFLCEPKRLWKRYLIGNIKFISLIIMEKFARKMKINTYS
jgi:N-acetylglucosaminyldiphosphoundecaprenol N-acetyl-beta-D-mannosaminyltransferase